MAELDLDKLLQLACPGPAFLAKRPGAALSLALHCLMLKDGFRLEDDAGSSSGRQYAPPRGWHSKFQAEWVFTYVKPGKANKFVLHCSLQEQTNRMFVHASETLNEGNIKVLGLQLENYVPDPEKLNSGNWAGVIARQDSLQDMFSQYITGPLTASAEDAPLDDHPWYTEDKPSTAGLTTTQYVLIGSAAVLAVALIVYRYRHH